MGIDPIRYKPWSGERTGHLDRIIVISKTFFLHKLKSKWIIALMILGLLVYAIAIVMVILMPHEALEGSMMAEQLGNPFFLLMSVLLISLICSDSIAEDLRSNSFVLYFSRAIRAESYLAGKIGGAILTMSVFCFFPPLIMALAVMGTQSGSEYGESLVVLGKTAFSGFVTTIFFIPLGMLVSSLTTRKSYAAVGTFMAFFVLILVGGAFSQFDVNWLLLDPTNILLFFNQALFGMSLPDGISTGLLGVMFSCFLALPLIFVYIRIHLKAVGK